MAHIQRQHWRSVDLTLERVAQVWKHLSGAQKLPAFTIAVAGTNGKGSCVAMLEAVLRDAGLTVGSYTSPHLVRYNERVRVDGCDADDGELCEAFSDIERARKKIPLTYFEFGTLCALLIFVRRQVDVAILEVGMGGRLDAVNIIDNDIALITSIGIDHRHWLGDTRERIANEKVGIVKPNAMTVCADGSPPPVIARVAATRKCTLLQLDADFWVTVSDSNSDGRNVDWQSNHPRVPTAWQCIKNLPPPLHGAHQTQNLAGVVAVLAMTVAHTGVTVANLHNGLARTTLAARCQVITVAGQEIILDVAHNADSARDLAAFIRARDTVTAGETHAVFAALADKPLAEIMSALADVVDRWYLADLTGERGQGAAQLQTALADITPAPATLHASPPAAFRAALSAATPRARVVAFGSFQTVGAIIADFEDDPSWR